MQQKPRCITLFWGSRAQKYCLSFLQQYNWKKERNLYGSHLREWRSISSSKIILYKVFLLGTPSSRNEFFFWNTSSRWEEATWAAVSFISSKISAQPLLTLLSLISAPPNPADHPAVWALKLQMTQCAVCGGNPDVSIKIFHWHTSRMYQCTVPWFGPI